MNAHEEKLISDRDYFTDLILDLDAKIQRAETEDWEGNYQERHFVIDKYYHERNMAGRALNRVEMELDKLEPCTGCAACVNGFKS